MSSISIPTVPWYEYCSDYEVHIVEEPAPKAHRFRYETEVEGTRTQGSIPGISSHRDRLTYPTIAVRGKHGPYHGPMLIIVCLVNPEDDLIHPHTISGKAPRSQQGNQYVNTGGVLQMITDGPEVVFKNIGVICVKKNAADVNAALQARINMRLDPFKKQFEHMTHHDRIDFNRVRLCFNVFLPRENYNQAVNRQELKYYRPLRPKCSSIIYDTRKLTKLKILRMNTQVKVGSEMLLFCEPFNAEFPVVILERDGWAVQVEDVYVHKRCGLCFTVPPYEGPPCESPIQVSLYLQTTNKTGKIERSKRAVVEYIDDTKFRKEPKNYLSTILQKPLIPLQEIMEQEPALACANNINEWFPQPSTSAANHRPPQCDPTNDPHANSNMFSHGDMEAVDPRIVCGQREHSVQIDASFCPIETPPPFSNNGINGVSPEPKPPVDDQTAANESIYPPIDNLSVYLAEFDIDVDKYVYLTSSSGSSIMSF